jgi:hypothetical protein
MVRQAVGEAVSSLPPRQNQLIKLAYFSDLSNRDIAQGLGITLSSVERGLRQAIARVSEHVERGRTAGRKAVYALAMFLGGRWLSEAHQAAGSSAQQWVKAGALLVVTAAAGAVLAAHPASQAPHAHVDQTSVPVVVSQPTDQVQQHDGSIRPVTQTSGGTVNATVPSIAGVQVAAPTVAFPSVTLPVRVRVVVPPVASVVHGLLGA